VDEISDCPDHFVGQAIAMNNSLRVALLVQCWALAVVCAGETTVVY
jgi:hypothetical protein